MDPEAEPTELRRVVEPGGGDVPDAGAGEPGLETLGLTGGPRPWQVELATGTAQQLHAATVDHARRSVRVQQVVRPALVLGSTQRSEVVDAAALATRGLELATRRSGGGAVQLEPGAQVWLDVVLPVGDPLWVDDVVRSSWWLGEVWAATLGSLAGVHAPAPEVHRGGVDAPELGALVCFAALGPGEVTVAGRKVVGISQRRTRHGARFQCVVPLRWTPDVVVDSLHLGTRRAAVATALVERAGAWSPERDPGAADPGRSDGAGGGAEPGGGAAGSVRAPAGLRHDPGWSVVEEFLHRLP